MDCVLMALIVVISGFGLSHRFIFGEPLQSPSAGNHGGSYAGYSWRHTAYFNPWWHNAFRTAFPRSKTSSFSTVWNYLTGELNCCLCRHVYFQQTFYGKQLFEVWDVVVLPIKMEGLPGNILHQITLPLAPIHPSPVPLPSLPFALGICKMGIVEGHTLTWPARHDGKKGNISLVAAAHVPTSLVPCSRNTWIHG